VLSAMPLISDEVEHVRAGQHGGVVAAVRGLGFETGGQFQAAAAVALDRSGAAGWIHGGVRRRRDGGRLFC